MGIHRNLSFPAILTLMVAFFISCYSTGKKEKDTQESFVFFVGTYTNGSAEGIYQLALHANGELQSFGLVAETANPSYLALSADRRYLLAVNEVEHSGGTGKLASYKIESNRLHFLGSTSSGGAHPCFVDVNAAGQVVVANYTGGNIGLLQMDEHGELQAPPHVSQHQGSGTTERQQAPHAHSACFEPDGSGIIAADLGTNQLWFYRIDDAAGRLLPREPYHLDMEPGAGPRHLAFHPSKKIIYVLNELNCTITQVRKDSAGNYSTGASYSTLPVGFTGNNLAAHLAVSSDAKFVYASNRGHNSIAIFRIIESDGSLQLIDAVSTRGEWPRHFALSPNEDFLVVANQYTGNLVSFRRDKSTGALEYVGETKLDAAVCVVF